MAVKVPEHGHPPPRALGVVLVVDDDPATQGALAELLVRAAYQLMQTTRCCDALRLAAEYQPDAIILDLAQPSAAGLIHALQASPATQDLPLVGTFAHNRRARVVGRGPAAAVLKPFKPGR